MVVKVKDAETKRKKKFAAPHYRLPGPMALQTVQASVEPRLSTTLKDRSVVPYSSPEDSARLRYMYMYPVSNSVVLVHRAGTLAKGYPLSKLSSKAEPVPIRKGNKHRLGLGLFIVLA